MPCVRLLVMSLLVAALTGCGSQGPTTSEAAPVDPVTRLALEVPLLVDPALETQSRRLAVMSDPGPLDGSLPPDDFAPAIAAAARAEAVKASGPAAATVLHEAPCRACSAPTLSLRTAAICKTALVADLGEAAKMPAALPVYPRAHLREAGAGKGTCAVRATSFTAPANASEVTGFYRALAAKSGFTLHTARSRTMAALIGKRDRDGARFAVIARPLPGRLSEIDLIVSGF